MQVNILKVEHNTLLHWEEDSWHFQVFPSVTGSDKPLLFFKLLSWGNANTHYEGTVRMYAVVLTTQCEVGDHKWHGPYSNCAL